MTLNFKIRSLLLAILISTSCSKEHIQKENFQNRTSVNSAEAITVEGKYKTAQNFSPNAVEVKVFQIITTVLNPSTPLTAYTSLSNDLGADESDLKLITNHIESFFEISIIDPYRLTTVGAWVEFVQGKVATLTVSHSHTNAVEISSNTQIEIDYFGEITKRYDTENITGVNKLNARALPVILQNSESGTKTIITYNFVSGNWDNPKLTWKGVITTEIQSQSGTVETKKYHTHIVQMPFYPHSFIDILNDTPHSKDPDSSVTPTILERINQVLMEELDILPEQIVPDASFTSDYRLDELDFISLIMEIEVEFEIEISDERAETILTVSDLYELVLDLTNFPLEPGLDDDVFDLLRTIIADTIGINPEEVVMEASIGDDLGADWYDSMDIIMNVEDEFDIAIPDHEQEQIVIVKDLYDLIIKYYDN